LPKERLNPVRHYERHLRRRWIRLGAESHFVQVRSERVHVLDIPGYGPLPPVVLVHGFSASGPTQYSAVMHYLRPRVSRVIVPDLPGHGHSALPTTVDADHMTEALAAAIDQVVDKPVLMFASSLGGAIGIRYAARSSSNLLGLMLCSPAGAPMPEAHMQEFVHSLRIDGHAKAVHFVDRMYGRRRRTRHLHALAIRLQFLRPQFRRLLDQVSLSELLSSQDLAALHMPTQLLWGEREALLPAANRDFFHRHLPAHAQLESPQNYSHVPFLENPLELAQRIVDFARSIRPRNPR